MEISVLLQSIISNKKYWDIYLSALNEHQCFPYENNSVVQAISSLLTKPNKIFGLWLLSTFLDQCSIEILEQKACLWYNLTLKAFNTRELESYGGVIFHVLAQLASKIHLLPDLVKNFSSTCLTKIYGALTKTPTSSQNEALHCVEVCLRLYPGPSGISRGIIERFLMRFIDTHDEIINLRAAKCYHLLLLLRGGTVDRVNHKEKWQAYQLQLMGSIHSTLDEAFAKCAEHCNGQPSINQCLSISPPELSDEPVERAAQLYIRFHNLIVYLETALREPFPVEKQIMPKKILNLIIRGLSVTCSLLEQHPISDNLAICILLPKMHYQLLHLLETLILTLRTHLIMHSEIILGSLCGILKWTSGTRMGRKRAFSNLRRKTYRLISLWIVIMQSGSRCEIIGDFLIAEILSDIFPYQIEFTLKVQAGTRKFLTKKSRHKLYKAQNEKSNIAFGHSSGNLIRKENFSDKENQYLCIAALHCLQQLLQSSCFLKPTVIKSVHIKILHICGLFYELPLERQRLYQNYVCRLKIYNILSIFVMAPHSLCPPPTELVMSILNKACMRDEAARVRINCGKILKKMEKIVHTQKEGLLYRIDMCDIVNAFKKYGQELLSGEDIDAEDDNKHVSTEIDENYTRKIKGPIVKDMFKRQSVNVKETVTTVDDFGEEEEDVRDNCSQKYHCNNNNEPLGLLEPIQKKLKVADSDDIASNEVNTVDNCSQKYNGNNNNKLLVLLEPIQKKLKLVDNRDTSSEKNYDFKEHLLLADIEAAFVDELSV